MSGMIKGESAGGRGGRTGANSSDSCESADAGREGGTGGLFELLSFGGSTIAGNGRSASSFGSLAGE